MIAAPRSPSGAVTAPAGARRPVLLAAEGDVNDVRTWSGTPFHLLQKAREQGLIDEGLPLAIVVDSRRQLHRYLWNLANLLRGRGRGGYAFSAPCLERLWAPQRRRLAGAVVINCYQLYPPSVVADPAITRWYYIDQTLRQLFDDYGLRQSVGPWLAEDAIRREQAGYHAAAGLIVHSHWAAESLIRDYGLPPERVQVVVPGANLDEAGYRQWAAGRAPPQVRREGELQLVFVGKDAQRKGLDRLVRALALARGAGAACRLRVIGCPPEELPPALRSTAGIDWLGYIDKRRETRRFIETVAEADVGCLLSRAEAGGIGLREYHALGLAVLGPQVGGSPDHVLADAAKLLPPDAGDEQVAALLIDWSRDREAVQRLRERSWAQREQVSWSVTVRRMAEVLAP